MKKLEPITYESWLGRVLSHIPLEQLQTAVDYMNTDNPRLSYLRRVTAKEYAREIMELSGQEVDS